MRRMATRRVSRSGAWVGTLRNCSLVAWGDQVFRRNVEVARQHHRHRFRPAVGQQQIGAVRSHRVGMALDQEQRVRVLVEDALQTRPFSVTASNCEGGMAALPLVDDRK
jgi:hypothetical protein